MKYAIEILGLTELLTHIPSASTLSTYSCELTLLATREGDYL